MYPSGFLRFADDVDERIDFCFQRRVFKDLKGIAGALDDLVNIGIVESEFVQNVPVFRPAAISKFFTRPGGFTFSQA